MKRLTMRQFEAYRVPRGAVTIWRLEQAGFIVKSPQGKGPST